MALILKDRVKESTVTTGTSSFALDGAVTGYQAFSAAIGNGNTTYYAVYLDNSTEWEVGIGTYSSSGNTLARTTILASSNSGSIVTFSAGTKQIWCDYPAGKAVYVDSSGNVTGYAISGGTINNTVIGGTTPVAGTFTNLTANDNVILGFSNADTLAVNGRITTDLEPNANNAKDIGTNGRNWRDAFFGRTLHTVNIEVTGTTSFDGSQGTAGQVLTSAGTGATPTWSTPTTGTVTSVTGTAPVVSSGGNTPAISMAAANTSTDGYLTSTDWNTFNSKGSGSVTSVNATVPSIFSVSGVPITGSGTIAMTYSGTALPAANGGTGLTSAGTAGNVLTSNGTAWVSSAPSAAATPITQNLDVVSTNQTIAAGSNGFSVGPMTINSGITVTVASGQRWVVI